MEYKTIVTRAGMAKIASAVAARETINLTEMAFGDGGGSYPDITEDMESLVSQKYRAPINKIEVVDDTNIKVSRVIPPSEGGYYIREVGVFDEDGTLIAVGTFPQTYKPTIEEGATKDVMANMIIAVNNVEVIELKIDPNITIATIEDLEITKQEILDKNIEDEVSGHEYKLVFKDNIPYFRVEKGGI